MAATLLNPSCRRCAGSEKLAHVPEADLKRLGFSLQKVRAIKGLAAAVADQQLDLADPEQMDNLAATRFLSSLHGIGRWSAEYVLLRGLGRLDTFPGDDVGARNNLQRLFKMDNKPDYEEIQALSSAWHPYQGLVYFHLLLDNLHARGLL